MLINSNLTPREAFNIYGALPEQMIEALLDDSDKLQGAEDIACYIHEARSQYPVEDCLSEQIADIQIMAKKLRGDNRESLLQIADQLEELQLSIGRATEYGASELDKATKLCNEIEPC